MNKGLFYPPLRVRFFVLSFFFFFTTFSTSFSATTTLIYTASSSITIPAGVTSVTLTVVGGGGGGGGGHWANGLGGGGGGGSSQIDQVVSVTAGNSYSIVIGEGGLKSPDSASSDGFGGSNGQVGGESSFGTTLVVAPGGSGGISGYYGGAGGSGGNPNGYTGTTRGNGGANLFGSIYGKGGNGGNGAYSGPPSQPATSGSSGYVIISYLEPKPSISSSIATSTTETSVVLGGTVDSVGGSSITSRGVCYGLTASSTTCISEGGTGLGTFSVSVSGFATSTSYYYYAYAVNSYGTSTTVGSYFTTEGLTNSLMFDSAQSQYLSRTFSTPTNRDKWTWSGWVKRSKLGAQQRIFSAYPSVGNGSSLQFNADDTLTYYSESSSANTMGLSTAAVFRDPSKWYHITLMYDYANSTADDRMQIYVDGVKQTSFVYRLNPPGPSYTYINGNTFLGVISSRNPAASDGYLDGYLSDVNFVDGQALTPSYFGRSDSNTGNWIPKAYQGTYGVNGFRLTFSSSTLLGLDTSGNGNTWTVNGGITSANNQVIDTPLNNFTVLNVLDKNFSQVSAIKKGNLYFDDTASGGLDVINGSFGVKTGKWYWEVTMNNVGSTPNASAGLSKIQEVGRSTGGGLGSVVGELGYIPSGSKVVDGVTTSYGASFTNGDIIGVAYDADAGSVTFYKNNSSQGSISYSADSLVFPSVGKVGNYGAIQTLNFGQKAFTYTPPSGYKALSTSNLPTPNILKPNQHFDVATYTGNGTGQIISGLDFQPDFVWIKDRNTSASSNLLDSVRGERKHLESNTTNAETVESSGVGLTSFNSSGFSLGSDNAGPGRVNYNSNTFVAWNWKGGNATTTNTSGTITSVVSANPTAGFSIVSYTGTGVNATVGHGLNSVPKMIITKNRAGAGANWGVYHVGNTVYADASFLRLDSISASLNSPSAWNSTAPTSAVFSVGTLVDTNTANSMIAYVFSEVPGYSKFGSYTGNGSADGPFVYTGFKPKFIMIKSTGSGDWVMIDTSRSPYNVSTNYLAANAATGEQTGQLVDVLSNGFKIRVGVSSAMNDNGTVYTYAAFAETTMIPTIPSLPSVSSPTATSTTETTVTLGGTVDSIGGSDLTSRGICYGTAPSPTSCTAVNGTSTGTFSVDITGLASSTTYYYRVYATNVAGTAYSTDSTFTTEGITNSLLLDSSQTQYLSKTLTSPTNNKKYTFSTWVKRSKLASEWDILSANNAGTESIYFSSSDDTMIIRDSASGLVKRTAQVFRDPSAWLHVVLAVDTTQATASNRNRLYINGVENTAWVTNTTDATLNASNNINSAIIHRMGSYNGSLGLADGYQAETYFIDGQQLTPSYFGQTSTTTSMWIPKSYAGTYGNNGFHLNFSNANNLGKDTSGNGNDWTLNGGITSSFNQTIDTPVNNFATLNPVDVSGTAAIANGSLQIQTAAKGRKSTFFVSSGKWAWEIRFSSTMSGVAGIGIADTSTNMDTWTGGNFVLYRADGGKQVNGSYGGAYGASYTNGDVIRVEYNADASTIEFFKQTGGTGSFVSQGTISVTPGMYSPAAAIGATSGIIIFNFGQFPFLSTPTTGYKSLSTANLPTPTILKPNQHFDTVTYTGNSSTKSISSLNFKPDLVWIKGRSYGSSNHILNDIVRGPNKTLFSNQSLAEYTDRGIESFDSNGFSLSGTEGGDANADTQTYVAWNWKGSNATTTNTAGSVTSVVSANPTAGFSVINYTGTGANGTVGHGLSSTPNFIIFKQRSGGAGSGVQDWGTYHSSIGSTGAVRLNLNNANVTNSTYFNNATPTATVINLGSFQNYNELNGNFIAYAFSEVPGYSKFGSYTGNGSTDGPFVYTGFKPRWIMIKGTGNSSGWLIYDTVRDTYNASTRDLRADLGNAEPISNQPIDILSNGFKLRTLDTNYNNASYGPYIYAAFAETGMIPVVSSTSTTQSGSSNLEDVTVTPGDTIATIDYTIPSNPSFNQVVVLRSTQPVTDTPVTGVSYNPGDIIGSAIVACVDSTIASSTFDYCTASSLSNNTAYYFKVFTKLGTIYTEVSVDGSPSTPNVGATNIAISSYRLRNDDGSEISAGYSSAENTPIVSSFIAGDKKRIRFVLSNQTSALTKKRYQLEYGTNSCTTWTALPRPGEETTEHFRMERSQFLSDNASTSHSSGVSAPNGRTFISGRIQSFSSLTHPITLRNGQYTEVEYVIRATNNVISNSPYCFRLTGAGSASGFTYSQTPQITPISIVFRRQGGGGSSVNNIINLESAVIVATTTYTGGGADGSITSTSTSIEATSTPSTQQSTTTPTRKRGGGGSVGSLKTTNYFASTFSKPKGMVLGATSDVVCTNLKHTSVYGQTDRNTNDEVSHMQYYLKQKGYFHGNVTGLFDKATERSLIEFQRNNGIRGTGILDEKTRNIIRTSSCPLLSE